MTLNFVKCHLFPVPNDKRVVHEFNSQKEIENNVEKKNGEI
jgi:hypothetical protein